MALVNDLDLTNLTDAKLLVERQKAAEKAMEGFSHDEWLMLRRRAKHDLFFLCSGVLGYKKLSTNLHGDLCTWMHATDNNQFREILLPRSHYKSTVVTIGDSIRVALPDDSGTSAWPRSLGTNARVCLGHEIHDMAARFLVSITGHFMSNPILMGLFPECVPTPRKHRINSYELELPRTEIWNEPTFDSFGVGAKSQGRHYNFLKLDDLFGAEARDSLTIRTTVYDWFDNIQAFFSAFAVDHFDLVGTRWGFDDIYSHAHAQYGALLKKYIRGVEEKDADGITRTIFPEEFPIDKLAILKKNPKVFNAQYANDPSAGGSEFDQAHLRYFEWDGPDHIIANGRRVNLRNCDIVILYDPAMNGRGGYCITANDHNDDIYVLKAKKHVWKPPEFVDELFLDVMKWNPRIVVIESVLFSELYQHWLIREMASRGIRFRIEPAKTRNRTKEFRIRGLDNFFTAHHIWFHNSQTDLIEEYRSFGASKDIHILDALAYGPEYWRRGSAISRASEKLMNLQDDRRDVLTGYSKLR